MADVGEPCRGGERDGEPGEVEGAALASGVLGDHDEMAPRAQHGVTGGVDLGHGRLVGRTAGVAEIGPIGRVVEGVVRAEPPAGQPRPLVDDPGVARVRRGGDDQVDRAGEIAEDILELAGVALADLGEATTRAVEHVVEVVGGERHPSLVEPDADGTPTEQGGLGEGGADPRQRVDDEIAGLRVLTDDAPGELGEHLPGVGGAGRQVAAGALPLGGGLGDRPDGERDIGTVGSGGTAGGGGRGHGRPRTGQASSKEQGVRPLYPTKSLSRTAVLSVVGGVREPSLWP